MSKVRDEGGGTLGDFFWACLAVPQWKEGFARAGLRHAARLRRGSLSFGLLPRQMKFLAVGWDGEGQRGLQRSARGPSVTCWRCTSNSRTGWW